MARTLLGRLTEMSTAAAMGVQASVPREREIVMVTMSVRVILFAGMTTALGIITLGVMRMTAVKSYLLLPPLPLPPLPLPLLPLPQQPLPQPCQVT